MNHQINRNWLQRRNISIIYDVTIYEHKDWIDGIKREIEKNSRCLVDFHNIVLNICNSTQDQGVRYMIHENGALAIIYVNKIFDDRQVILLCYPIRISNQNEINSYITQYSNLNNTNNLLEIAQISKRAYPGYIVADRDIWCDIEEGKYEGVHLALSPEEMNLLREYRLPIFITGLAGSGKTTMMLFIFSEYLFLKIKDIITKENNYPEDIIFLSYSQKLIDNVKKLAKKIIDSKLSQTNIRLTDEERSKVNEIIEKSFLTFDNFLIQIIESVKKLNDNEIKRNDIERRNKIDRFLDKNNFIDFPKFKSITHLNSSQDLSPEFLWYVIRTYIKGYKSDTIITPENYEEEVFENDRRIPNDRFETAFQWYNGWYKNFTEEGRSWDMIDLVRECIYWVKNYPQLKGNYAVIFCDEAQDFTQIEIELIIMMSHYTNNQINLNNQNLFLPFALAGDPSQSLNPTGFNWERIRSIFWSKLNECNITINTSEENIIRTLKMNYRSTPEIAKFANFIQFIRRYKFQDENYLGPQDIFNIGHISSKVKLISIEGGHTLLDGFKNFIKDGEVIVILPCDTGKELEFIRSDTLLREIFDPEGKLNEIPKNIFSVYEIKGLEFPKVMLYKWGDYYTQNRFSINFDRQLNNVNQIFLEKYLFTKLYVAITRAEEKLFLVDTQDGMGLWNILFNNDRITTIKNNITQEELNKWQNNIDFNEFLEKGNLDILEGDIINRIWTAEQLIGYANKLMQNAELKDDDPDSYRRAIRYFEEAMKREDFDINKKDTINQAIYICSAKMYKKLGRYKDAGDYFSKLGQYDDACECYFHAGDWSLLSQYGSEYGIRSLFRYIAEFMQNRNIDNACKIIDWIISSNNNQDLIKNIHQRITVTNRWKSEVLPKLVEILNNNITQIRINPINITQFAYNYGFNHRNDLYKIAAELNYNEKSYKFAVELWEKIGENKDDNEKYCYARACLSDDINEKIKWLYKAKKFDEIKKVIKERPALTNQINNTVKNLIIDAFKNLNDYFSAFEFVLNNNMLREAISIYNETYDFKQREKIRNKIKEQFINNDKFRKEYLKFFGKQKTAEFFNELLDEINIDNLEKYFETFKALLNDDVFFNDNEKWKILQKFAQFRKSWKPTQKIEEFLHNIPENLNILNIEQQEIGNIFDVIEIFLDPFDKYNSLFNDDEKNKVLYEDVLKYLLNKTSEDDEKERIKKKYFKMLLNLKDKTKDEDKSDYESKIYGLAQKYGQNLNDLKRSEKVFSFQLNEIKDRRLTIPEDNPSFVLKIENSEITIIDLKDVKNVKINIQRQEIIENNDNNINVIKSEKTLFFEKKDRYNGKIKIDSVEISFYVEDMTYKYEIKL